MHACRVSTAATPAVVIVGDAACATTWRLGYSLETAIDGAIALSDSLFKSTNLSEALESLNAANKIAEANALARIDRVVHCECKSSFTFCSSSAVLVPLHVLRCRTLYDAAVH